VVVCVSHSQVKWTRVVYSSFADYAADAEWLVTRPSERAFDYVEGFAFCRNDDPVNGWPSVPIPGGAHFEPSLLPAGAGPVLYCLEVALYQHHHQHPDDVEEVRRQGRKSRRKSSINAPLAQAVTLRWRTFLLGGCLLRGVSSAGFGDGRLSPNCPRASRQTPYGRRPPPPLAPTLQCTAAPGARLASSSRPISLARHERTMWVEPTSARRQ
jgi:hypothetical protein